MKRILSVLVCLILLAAGCAPGQSANSFIESNGWWRTMLTQSGWNDEICYLTVHRDTDYTSAGANGIFEEPEDYSATLSFPLILNTAKETGSIGSVLNEYSFYNLFTPGGEQYTGQFYEKGISMVSPQGETVYLAIADNEYNCVKENLSHLFDTDCLYSSPLTHINVKECKSIRVQSADGVTQKTYDSRSMRAVTNELGYIMVVPNAVINIDKGSQLEEAASIHVEMSDGSYYDVQCSYDALIVYESTSDLMIQYQLYYGYSQNVLGTFNSLASGYYNPRTAKPVIYLYPEKPTNVSVQLTFQGRLTYTYPVYNKGWNVTAYPDGRILNRADGSEHYYLFWEGTSNQQWDFSKGFVVAGKDTEAFLKKSLVQLGLTPKEYNDFLVFWVPRMQDNAYNLITFATAQYEELAPLKINPQPDSILRVHMVYKPLENPVAVHPQQLSGFTRKGFTVVEWGGTEVK